MASAREAAGRSIRTSLHGMAVRPVEADSLPNDCQIVARDYPTGREVLHGVRGAVAET
jgi:hypothetical protein